MTPTRRRPAWIAAAATAVVAACLSGCISLLPKSKPAQLYRFGAETSVTSTPIAPAESRFTVRGTFTSFTRPSAGDRILTVTGDQTAYIAGARWVTSAETLFDAAVVRAFDVHGGPARLLARGESSPADYVLKLDVRGFEARYDQGLRAAPTVVVEVYAALDNIRAPDAGREQIFQASIPAGGNTVGAIARAFDQAVASVTGQIVAWVDRKGA